MCAALRVYCVEKVLKLTVVASLPLLPAVNPFPAVNIAVDVSVKVAIPVGFFTFNKLSALL